MFFGEQITRTSVWVALVIGTLGFALRLGGHPGAMRWGRWAWTLGCACFLGHVAAAFSVFHHWSHAAAYDEVARQTAAFSGMHWGGGIYFNYVFAAAWLGDVLWWWVAPASWLRRSVTVDNLWHGYFLFMMGNGAIVFVHGPMRWLGVVLCAIFAVSWWRARSRNILYVRASQPD